MLHLGKEMFTYFTGEMLTNLITMREFDFCVILIFYPNPSCIKT
jgi:hypothetical protein